MIIYKDIISDDEIISDSFPMKEVDGIVYECDCSMIKLQDIVVNTGANASAEEAPEILDEPTEAVNNIISTFRLNATSLDKKSYLYQLKGYMKMVKEKMKANGVSEEDITSFENKARSYVKKILDNFKDYEFYTGESMDPDGMIVLLNYREDGITPYITIWKDGLVPLKV